jgi:putative oxidoreductase
MYHKRYMELNTSATLGLATRTRTIAVWALSIVLALGFLAAGTTKLAGIPIQAQIFQQLGYPNWFMYVTGALETAAALALLVPRYALAGVVIIICVMVGAVGSPLIHGQASTTAVPIVLLAAAVAVGYLRSWRNPFAGQDRA